MKELEHTYPLVGKRVRQLRERSSARNRRKSSGPLMSRIRSYQGIGAPLPLGREARAATGGGKLKSQKVLGSCEVCAADLLKELERPYPYPLVGERVIKESRSAVKPQCPHTPTHVRCQRIAPITLYVCMTTWGCAQSASSRSLMTTSSVKQL